MRCRSPCVFIISCHEAQDIERNVYKTQVCYLPKQLASYWDSLNLRYSWYLKETYFRFKVFALQFFYVQQFCSYLHPRLGAKVAYSSDIFAEKLCRSRPPFSLSKSPMVRASVQVRVPLRAKLLIEWEPLFPFDIGRPSPRIMTLYPSWLERVAY